MYNYKSGNFRMPRMGKNMDTDKVQAEELSHLVTHCCSTPGRKVTEIQETFRLRFLMEVLGHIPINSSSKQHDRSVLFLSIIYVKQFQKPDVTTVKLTKGNKCSRDWHVIYML